MPRQFWRGLGPGCAFSSARADEQRGEKRGPDEGTEDLGFTGSGEGFADFANQTAFDFRGFFRTDAQNPSTLRQLFEFSLHAEASDVQGLGLDGDHVQVSKAGDLQ